MPDSKHTRAGPADELVAASDLHAAIALLERLAADWRLLDDLSVEDRQRLHRAVARLYEPDSAARRRRDKDAARLERAARASQQDALLDRTGIRMLRRRPVFTTPNVFPPPDFAPQDVPPDGDTATQDALARAEQQGDRATPRDCYICHQTYSAIHHFYDQLCPSCADLNFRKRTESADLRGRCALVTGGRVKIGYQACLKLLRGGASVIVTTRFPRDAAARYAREADYGEWADRLEIAGLDLRHTPSVDAFCRELAATRARLDFIVNNACQTVRRPPGFYAHLMAAERERGGDAAIEPARVQARLLTLSGLAHAAERSQVALLADDLAAPSSLFPEGQFDQDDQQIDLRDRNSWRLLLAEVSPVELLEVHLVNAIAPFIINARLKPLMLRTPGREKHIVNVSAMEGQFYRTFKTTRHPHTNMAKAALNMMTRTSAADYHGDGIHMNSVDTGWVTDEDPETIAARKTREQRFHPPLDVVDGAARIVDPIIDGLNTGSHAWGQFLKDYRPTDW